MKQNLGSSAIRARLSWLVSPGTPLSRRVISAGFWALVLRVALRASTLVRTIIVVRLLAPGDLGLMGISLLMVSLLESFTTTGFSAALIQRKGDIRPYLDTAWSASILRGAVLACALLLAAPYIATFFDAPAAVSIVRVMAASIFINGLSNIGMVSFQKDLEFQKLVVFRLGQTIAEVGVGIGAVLILQNVWALVFGSLAGSLIGLILSYALHPYRPRFRLDLHKAKELYTFGRWVLASTILFYLVGHGDDILVGRILGVTALGLYQIAFSFSNFVALEVNAIISSVTFPAYAKLQDERKRLREAYLRVFRLTTAFSVPVAVAILVLGPDFTSLFLGDRWLPMVPALQVLALFGLVRSMASTTGAVFYGVGRPSLPTKLGVLEAVLMAIIIVPLTLHWGILGTAIATTVALVVTQGIGTIVLIRLLGCPANALLRILATPITAAAVMVLAITLLQVATEVGMAEFIGAVLLAIPAYGAAYYGFSKAFSGSARSDVQAILGR